MTMTSRERVQRCLAMDGPDRVPRDLWCLPGAVFEHGEEAIGALRRRWPVDITQVHVGRVRPHREQGDAYEVGRYVDEWGCVFENVQRGVIGEVKQPMVDDWAKLDLVQPPVELLQVDVDAVNAWCRDTDRFVLAGGWGRLFERIQFLRGTENVYYDLAEESDEFLLLLDRVHGFYRDQFEVWAKTDVDALMLMDDWGSQMSLLINPEQWRRLFKPRYAQYTQIAHEHGKKFFMHSDGRIMDIYEDLVEIGVDAINSQLFCMDIAEIGRRFAGRITFWGEIDRQQVIPFGSPEDCEAAVGQVVEHLWRPEGGVIAQFELGPGVPLANAEAIFQAWDRLAVAPVQPGPAAGLS